MNYNDIENENNNANEDIINVIELEEDNNSIIHNIIKTDNIELYDKLSLEEKIDFKVVRYLITKYHFNRDFTLKVVKNYIDHKRFDIEDNEYVEILILINKFKSYLGNVKPEEDELKLKLDMFYNTIWKYAETRVEEEAENIDFPKRYLGLGYKYINEKYNEDKLKIIRDYIATRKIYEIFEDKEIIEKYIHKTYETKEAFLKISLPRFIIDYLYDIDSALCSYLTRSAEILDELTKMYVPVIYNWEMYEEENKINSNAESKDICEFINMYCDGSIPKEISKRQVFKHLARKLEKKELYDYAKELEKEEDDEIACYIYVTKMEEAEEEIKKRNLPDTAFPIITIEENISDIYNKLSSSTINWLKKLESVVQDIYINGVDTLKKARLDIKEDNVTKIIRFDQIKKS